MSRVLFFSLPAHGHVNPTLPVVRELMRRGHEVRYVMAESFRARIEACGGTLVPLDAYLPPAPRDLQRRVRTDFASLIEMAADTALAMDGWMREEAAKRRPDVVVADSACVWGKLFAQRCALPWVCSTTTFAFNAQLARYMKQSPVQLARTLLGAPRMNAAVRRLREAGYPVENWIQLIENRDDVDTIVYTTRAFQPMAQTFGARFAFVGPCVDGLPEPRAGRKRPLVYVSLGTVLADAPFFRECARALAALDCDAVLSVGEGVKIADLGELPERVRAYPRVDQLRTLAEADVFVTHCGMNSVSEALLLGVPMVLFPQHEEENAVALRAEELGAGLRLRRGTEDAIRDAVRAVLADGRYRASAQRMREDFLAGGGAPQAADVIVKAADAGRR